MSAYYIDRIEDAGGKVLQQADARRGLLRSAVASPIRRAAPERAPARARRSSTRRRMTARPLIPAKNLAPQIIRPQVAYLLADMMADVIRRGTGVRARVAQSRRHRRQDRHHQRSPRRLVQRLQRRSRHDGLDRIRSGPLARARRGRRARGGADLDVLHARGAGAAPRGTGCRCPTASSRCASRPTRGLLASSDNPNGIMEKFIEGNLPKPESYEGPEQPEPDDDGDKPLF